MATWEFGSGVRLESGGRVVGEGKLADALRVAIKQSPTVQALPHPAPPTPLRADSDYLLNVFALDFAHGRGIRVSTEYEPDLDDAPEDVREELRRIRQGAQYVPYGTVH